MASNPSPTRAERIEMTEQPRCETCRWWAKKLPESTLRGEAGIIGTCNQDSGHAIFGRPVQMSIGTCPKHTPNQTEANNDA